MSKSIYLLPHNAGKDPNLGSDGPHHLMVGVQIKEKFYRSLSKEQEQERGIDVICRSFWRQRRDPLLPLHKRNKAFFFQPKPSFCVMVGQIIWPKFCFDTLLRIQSAWIWTKSWNCVAINKLLILCHVDLWRLTQRQGRLEVLWRAGSTTLSHTFLNSGFSLRRGV